MCKRNINHACYMPPKRDLASTPGMCPNRELNREPSILWDNAQPTEPHQSGLGQAYFNSAGTGAGLRLPSRVNTEKYWVGSTQLSC